MHAGAGLDDPTPRGDARHGGGAANLDTLLEVESRPVANKPPRTAPKQDAPKKDAASKPTVDRPIDEVLGAGPKDANARRSDVGVQQPPVVAPPVKQPTPVAAAREYTIKQGDILGLIAQRELGSVRFVADIEKLNPGLDARHLRPGKTILLPTKGASSDDSGAARLQRAGAYRDYVVGKGDTLERIARVELGSPRRVEELKELNPGLRPTRMRIGQKIKLPIK